MPSLKDLRNRISSVKSTQKITSAMKMVAASKLRRAQEQVEAARSYAERLERMVGNLADSVSGAGVGSDMPKMMTGTGREETYLFVVFGADRGLCGGYNASVYRHARTEIKALMDAGKTVRILPVGRKAKDLLRRSFKDSMLDGYEHLTRGRVQFADLEPIAERITTMYEKDEFDVCVMIFNKFRGAISFRTTEQQLIPFVPPEPAADEDKPTDAAAVQSGPHGAADTAKPLYEYEPSEEDILKVLLPRNLAIQIFQAYLEAQASEHGARMAAMDNATRNAGDMIDRLTLTYNRERQATITRELIEIISGAEAV